jgi:flagellar basal-body rod protein FlgF
MMNSIYTPLSGSIAQEKVMDIIANNLANMNTVGFKEESVTFKLLNSEPEKNYKEPLPPGNYKLPFEDLVNFPSNDVSYVGISGVHRNLSQGSPITTHNPLDLMIEGDGYLQVMTKEGVRFTRNGSLTLNDQGILVDGLGHPILGEKGNISIRSKDFQINHLGEIYQNGQYTDKLLVSQFQDPSLLERVGYNHFHYSGPQDGVQGVDFPKIKQGFLEGSNVNAMKNLTQMIIAHRSFEAYQKAIKNHDSMMEKSSNSIGELRG